MEGEPYERLQIKYGKRTIYLDESDVERYNRWMLEDIAEGRKREEQKKKEEQRKKEEAEKEKSFDEKHNIKRDSKGRLNKGALLAKKEAYNEAKIYLLFAAGASAKEIVEHSACSKSTVYRIISKYNKKQQEDKHGINKNMTGQ